ncbi:hypothetical protein [Aridibaculum aurantiacum]|uniref:hypothetical protein n=1 Tax=Aridibaculum aurantiacum TaxID=2810307 RepID=UPI001A979726|nr:hypothetical protein [Aridibaculum aurantiacum]
MKLHRFSILALPLLTLCFSNCQNSSQVKAGSTDSSAVATTENATSQEQNQPQENTLDTAKYNALMAQISNNDTTGLWPAKTPYPVAGAVLPFNRIIAYYGNLYSTRMGILGELPKQQMLKKLQGEVDNWQKADSSIPVIPALHYIAVTAQSAPGKDGKYRLRMPFHQVDTIVNWAKEIDALVFVDIQIGLSSLQNEVPELEQYLKMPQVHLGIDPEFSMKGGQTPGRVIGSFNADDINYVINYLSGIVRDNNLPPKMLVIHRFTQGMVTGYDKIKPTPEVQVIMDMDGWGDKILKRSTWQRYIYREPVQFTGFKIFYKNDTKNGSGQLFSPQELLQLTPKPLYIQYQ